MRRVTIILIVVALLTGGVLVLVGKPDLLTKIGLGGDAARVRQLTNSFLEDIQFKDFKKAASYHSPQEQKTVDIPFLLERLFLIKPEQLDVMEWEIIFAKVDSSALRGRSKSRIKIKDLLRGKLKERELMLYYYRETPKSPWYMRLESSLRKIEADKKKKH